MRRLVCRSRIHWDAYEAVILICRGRSTWFEGKLKKGEEGNGYSRGGGVRRADPLGGKLTSFMYRLPRRLQHDHVPSNQGTCMPGIITSADFVCARYLRARRIPRDINFGGRIHVRAFSSSSPPQDGHAGKEEEQGAMSRRLQDLSDESLESGGKGARKVVEEAGFSEELRRRLEEKIANASFKSENAAAFAQANMPASAGKEAREAAAAAPWTGTESVHDASLRMLTDAHKPLRSPARSPGVRGPPSKIDTGRPRKPAGSGTRIANARDRSSFYAFVNDSGISEEEREKFRQEMKQRFQPGARSAPATLQGLASLANERIENAIARGQFKNLPRGQKLETDHNANSPFINTTEYFMNKMIQRQDIVPPWIEKQQELVATATRFRGRLRADWKRHVARVIASRGGSLESQMKLADEYALAESLESPSKRDVEQLNTVDDAGHVSQITITGKIEPTTEGKVEIVERAVNEDGSVGPSEGRIVVTADVQGIPSQQTARQPTVPPFRDAQWEEIEKSYHTLAVENLNSLTRSYNLMAPNPAKKPYYSLKRELRSCFADVAPQVAAAIRERALAPKIKGIEVIGHKPGGVLEKFSMDNASHVYDERKPQYGFKEFWKDLFAAKT